MTLEQTAKKGKTTPAGPGDEREPTESRGQLRTEAALHMVAERYRSLCAHLFDTSNDGILVCSLDGNIAVANDALIAMLGYSADELTAMTYAELTPERWRTGDEVAERQLRESGVSPERNKEFLHRDGYGVPVVVRAWHEVDDAGLPARRFETVHDISADREAQIALEASEERFRAVADYTFAWENWHDTTGRLLWTNPAVQRITGYSVEECLAMDGYPLPIVHPESRTVVRELLARAISDRTRGRAQQFKIVTKGGQTRWVAMSWQPIFGRRQQWLGYRSSVRDVSERRQAETTALEASRLSATTALAGGIAHRFNNLLASVVLNVDQVSAELDPEALQQPMLTVIKEAAKEGGELTRRLISFSGNGKHWPTTTDLNKIITEVLELQERAQTRGVQLVTTFEPHIWGIKADAGQMSLMLHDLYTNAVEAVRSGGTVTITTKNLDHRSARGNGRAPGLYVCLIVEDDGQGMTPEVKSQIFEPFFSTKREGRGMGLASVQGVVHNHGGTVEVWSEPGQGAKFTICLPAVPLRPAPASRPLANRSGSETILVVDDDDRIRTITKRVLERLGYHVLTAANGHEAVESARRHTGEIHLCVLDLVMPVMGGAEAYPLLMAVRPELKVILFSGCDLDRAAQGLLDAGANAFLSKPTPIRGLAKVIRRVLDE